MKIADAAFSPSPLYPASLHGNERMLDVDMACAALDFYHMVHGAPKTFTEENRRALVCGDWQTLGELMLQGGFFSASGVGAVVADYRVWRPGVKSCLSLLVCRKDYDIEEFPFDVAGLQLLYGCVDYTPVIPVHIMASLGNIGGAQGELFIVPTAWKKMPALASAAPLLDIDAQIARMRQKTKGGYWRTLVDGDMADLIEGLMADDDAYRRAMHWEYALHEYGHACGRFAENSTLIASKMSYAAFEEWRSDGVMAAIVRFHMEKGLISDTQARNILISNFMTRFGVDITRQHDRIDHDFLATYFTLRGFLYSGKMAWEHGRLCATRGDVSHVDFWLSLYAPHSMRANIATRMDTPALCVDDLLPHSDYTLEEFHRYAQQGKRA